jgi:dTDP-4-dehydrorhamnose 3,5-epimerase
MIFTETSLKGSYIIEPERLEDERGFFARTFCRKEFATYGLNPNFVQCNISYNRKKGIIRGMHFQAKPYEEVKIVRVTRGIIYDVILDLRTKAPTFKQWIAIELSEENRKMVYIPEGLAHGFQTLQDETEVFYQMSEFYFPESARGIRWNDPSFKIEWPIQEQIISTKDSLYSDFE